MNRPFIPEVRKANMTGDFREIALSLCVCTNNISSLWREPKYVPFGRSYAKDAYYTFDGRKLLDESSAFRYVCTYAAENNMRVSDFLIDVPGYPTDFELPCRCWTVKNWLETEIDNYDIIPSYEQAFKDIFNLKYKKDVELRTNNIEKYVHVMSCLEPDEDSAIPFNVVSTEELSNIVKAYAEMLEAENKMSLYFDEY